jgi:hypothetical protein
MDVSCMHGRHGAQGDARSSRRAAAISLIGLRALAQPDPPITLKGAP